MKYTHAHMIFSVIRSIAQKDFEILLKIRIKKNLYDNKEFYQVNLIVKTIMVHL